MKNPLYNTTTFDMYRDWNNEWIAITEDPKQLKKIEKDFRRMKAIGMTPSLANFRVCVVRTSAWFGLVKTYRFTTPR